MLVGAWGWRRDRTRIRQHLLQIPRHAAARIPFVFSHDDPLQPGPGLSVTYDVVFQEPSPNGSGLIDSASTEVTITGLSNPTPTPTPSPNISVSVFFEGIVTRPITPGPGVYFLTAPGGLFDVAAYLRGQQAPDVPADLSVVIAAASVPKPSSLTLCGIAALILGVALRYRSGVRSAGRLPLDRSRLHKK